MTQPLFHSEQLAAEWATRICGRLKEIGVPETEVSETHNIILTFTRIAADELSSNRQITVPHADEPVIIDAKRAHLVIDLFLRGVNQMAKKLRDTGLPWEQRREHLESLAWKLFNLSKILVGFLCCPNPDMPKGLNSEKDLQLMMKQSAEALFREQVQGAQGISMPWTKNWRP